jgi:hypothetical protein
MEGTGRIPLRRKRSESPNSNRPESRWDEITTFWEEINKAIAQGDAMLDKNLRHWKREVDENNERV